MLKTCILEAQNTFFHQILLRNMDTVTIQKIPEISRFHPHKSRFWPKSKVFGMFRKFTSRCVE